MAGLNFPNNAALFRAGASKPGEQAVAAFEFIPYILSACRTLKEARALLAQVRLVNLPFSPKLPPSPLHYLLADKTGCLAIEPVKEGLMVYENPVGVLTNNPPFPMQLTNLANYSSLSRKDPVPHFADGFAPALYSRGMGGIGLPGAMCRVCRGLCGLLLCG